MDRQTSNISRKGSCVCVLGETVKETEESSWFKERRRVPSTNSFRKTSLRGIMRNIWIFLTLSAAVCLSSDKVSLSSVHVVLCADLLFDDVHSSYVAYNDKHIVWSCYDRHNAYMLLILYCLIDS